MTHSRCRINVWLMITWVCCTRLLSMVVLWRDQLTTCPHGDRLRILHQDDVLLFDLFNLDTVDYARLLIWWEYAIAETEWMMMLNSEEVIVWTMDLMLITKSEVFTRLRSRLNNNLIWLIAVSGVVWLSHLDITGLLDWLMGLSVSHSLIIWLGITSLVLSRIIH